MDDAIASVRCSVLDRLLAGLLGDQLLEADEVVLAILGRVERVRVGLGQPLPRRVVGQVVVACWS